MKFQRKPWPGRFWDKVNKTNTCWLWTGALNEHGYGVVAMGADHSPRNELAHRVSWALKHGPIPPGVMILHRCDNPPCVRDEHLFDGSQSDNMKDSAQKGRHPRNRTQYLPTGKDHHHYQQGHKLTRDRALEIRASTGLNVEVAARFGVSASLVSLIRSGKIWREDHHG